MAPTGFEPATPGLKVQYSNRAELRGLVQSRNKLFLNAFVSYISIISVFEMSIFPL